MAKIQTIFFWLGGVITQTIPEVVARGLYCHPIEKVNIQARLHLRELVEDLYLGRMTGLSFCERAIEASGISFAAEELEAMIKDTVPLRASVLEVIKELPDTYQLWLISDYPPDWYGAIAERFGLSAYFPEDRLIFTSGCGLPRIVPNIFYYLVRQADQPMEACLMIDGRSARAVEAVKHGLPSAIFVDARRLKLDFILRRMLPPPPGFTYPGPSKV